ncbi:hypothetical protein GH714_009714 [Hevea brasiliensis]|uniref:Cytochrome P450 n=1 Tax=Hevea brasiliensis TaxID=3981 RepID=A0A6A6M433_HEVBR|nr:hypothetical protein GH714_009714 [Hevea brasiliensis]
MGISTYQLACSRDVPQLSWNSYRLHDFFTCILQQSQGTFLFKGHWFGDKDFVFTSDSMNIHHILSKNFANYHKGEDFREIFEPMGDGIFISDSDNWRNLRRIFHSVLKSRRFELAAKNTMEQKILNGLFPILKNASMLASEVDIQDVLKRFMFDNICLLVLGLDPNSLSPEFPHIPCAKAYDDMSEAAIYRHTLPGSIWKLQRDTAFNLLAAGRDTVAAGLAWFFWLVATHPFVEKKILEEMEANLREGTGGKWKIFSIEEVSKLVYLHAVICETLRLYPPVPFEHKASVGPDILPSGHQIPGNMKIIYCLYSMGRMEDIWGKDFLEFKPERWISESGEIKHVPSYKFITFNAGPRTCLGKDLTFLQMKTVASTVLWNFSLQVVENHPLVQVFLVTFY